MSGESGPHPVEDAHRVALMRSEALAILREEPLSRSELQDRLGVSKTTAYRTTNALLEHGFAERTNGEYALTAAGTVAAERAEALCRAISAVEHVDPLFELIDRQAIDLDPSLFGGAVVTHATQAEPYAPHRRFWAVVREAAELRLLYNTVHAPEAITRYVEVVENGLDLTVVYDRQTAETNVGAIGEHEPDFLSSGNVELRVASDAIGAGVAITEDRVGIMGHDPAKGTPVVAVDTDDTEALGWANSLFESHYASSEPVSSA